MNWKEVIMKNKNRILTLLITLASFSTYSQQLVQYEVEQLVKSLNRTIAPKVLIEFHGNKASFTVDELNKTLDVRTVNDIAQDTMSSQIKASFHNNGRYSGPIFWEYDFRKITSSKTQFRANKSKLIFCTISFRALDTITIKSNLNQFTSHHKTQDATEHTVNWLNDKYISILMKPKRIDGTIRMEVRGITISGKFQRKDQKLITENYTKTLRKILRREFEKIFESKEMSILVSNYFKI